LTTKELLVAYHACVIQGETEKAKALVAENQHNKRFLSMVELRTTCSVQK
jgi:hypothetical protein